MVWIGNFSTFYLYFSSGDFDVWSQTDSEITTLCYTYENKMWYVTVYKNKIFKCCRFHPGSPLFLEVCLINQCEASIKIISESQRKQRDHPYSLP